MIVENAPALTTSEGPLPRPAALPRMKLWLVLPWLLILILYLALNLVFDALFSPSINQANYPLVGIYFLLVFLLTGFLQQLVVRRFFPKARWLLAASASFILGVAVRLLLNNLPVNRLVDAGPAFIYAYSIGFNILSNVALTLLPWLVLRQQVRKAWVYPLVYTAAFVMGDLLYSLASRFLPGDGSATLVGNILLFGLISIASGLALRWLANAAPRIPQETYPPTGIAQSHEQLAKYRPNGGRAGLAKVLYASQFVLVFIAFFVMEPGQVNVLKFLSTAIGVIAAVVFFFWLYRAYQNLNPLGVTDMEDSPGWAVGAFFVPFLSFYMPYRVLSNGWKASSPSLGPNQPWRSQRTAGLVGWWWAFFLTNVVVSQVYLRVKSLQQIAWLGSLVAMVTLAFLALQFLLVDRLHRRQEQKRAALSILAEPAAEDPQPAPVIEPTVEADPSLGDIPTA
jgi:hypothetical protein